MPEHRQASTFRRVQPFAFRRLKWDMQPEGFVGSLGVGHRGKCMSLNLTLQRRLKLGIDLEPRTGRKFGDAASVESPQGEPASDNLQFTRSWLFPAPLSFSFSINS